MGYLDSDWGYASFTLQDTTFSDGAWGYTTTSLNDPVSPGEYNDSSWAIAQTTLTNPHHPIGVYDGTTIRYVPIQTWDGDLLR